MGPDPNPNPANLLRTLSVAMSRSWGKAAFLCLKMRLGKNLRSKKKFWPVSDLEPNPGFEYESETYFRPDPDPKPNPKLLFRIRNTAIDGVYLIFSNLGALSICMQVFMQLQHQPFQLTRSKTTIWMYHGKTKVTMWRKVKETTGNFSQDFDLIHKGPCSSYFRRHSRNLKYP